MRCIIMRVYLSAWGWKLVNSFAIAHPVVFQMPLFMPLGTGQVHAAVLVCSLCTCLIVLSELLDNSATKVLCRMLRLSGASPSDVVENHGCSTSVALPSIFDPVDCWFIIALTIFYNLHKCLILPSLSQVLRINQCLCM